MKQKDLKSNKNFKKVSTMPLRQIESNEGGIEENAGTEVNKMELESEETSFEEGTSLASENIQISKIPKSGPI